ncbi:uncharacterized protein LOC128863853 [Anastrepha ludens]|uniref:uncharacterized protein LOC128863853 n=1 Tax=Anastrepha ludens TaxID=28586 RepID=UPI0023B1772F|nr:uncharacterized protein LOC128863853 [Anastrepha ludens]
MDKKQKCELITSIFQSIREAMQLDSDDSDKEEILLGLARLGEKAASLPIKRAKREWIKEWRKNRCDRGSFAFLNKELLVHDEQSYRNFLRVSKSQFDYLLSLIANEIQRSDSTMRAAIPAAEKLALTLRFLSTGESYVSLDYQTRLSKSSISCIVPGVCSALYNKLKSSYLKFPNSNSEWEAIAKEFAVKWQFPNCIGALDAPINLKVATVEEIVLTCCALHNYLIENGEMFTDERVNAETVNNNHSTDSDVFYNLNKK